MGKFWEFRNVAEGEEPTLYVYGDIVSEDLENWSLPDDVVPSKFKNELDELGEVSKINVRINSYGGAVFAANAIKTLLKAHKAEIIVYIDGIAASAATIIAMAGDKIIMPKGSMMMIHNPINSIYGAFTESDLIKLANNLSQVKESIIETYMSRTSLSKDEIIKMMDEETWMTSSKAIELGFADKGLDTEEVVAYIENDNASAFFNGRKFDFSNFKNKDILISNIKNVKNINNNLELKPKGVNNKMTYEEFKNTYHEIYNKVKEEGYNLGVSEERNRIQEIENLTMPGMEDIAIKAKFETYESSQTFYKNIVKNHKEKGMKLFNNRLKDTETLNAVPACGQSLNSKEEENRALLNYSKKIANSIRG